MRSQEGARVVYLSDYTALLPPTDALLSHWSALGHIDLLVLDALRMEGAHPVHATGVESVQLARRWAAPKEPLPYTNDWPLTLVRALSDRRRSVWRVCVTRARRLRPRRTLLVGMGHTMEHEASNRQLRRLWLEEGLDVQLAYDGQFVPLPLSASQPSENDTPG